MLSVTYKQFKSAGRNPNEVSKRSNQFKPLISNEFMIASRLAFRGRPLHRDTIYAIMMLHCNSPSNLR